MPVPSRALVLVCVLAATLTATHLGRWVGWVGWARPASERLEGLAGGKLLQPRNQSLDLP